MLLSNFVTLNKQLKPLSLKLIIYIMGRMSFKAIATLI